MMRSPKRKTTRAATLADVGREAGVSAMAVSAVLNGARTSSRIAEDTRERIRVAAKKLNYRPNIAARALANRRMDTLGVAGVVDTGELNLYFLEALNGVIEGAARHNQNVTVFTLHDWCQDVRKLAGFCDGRIDGLVLLAPTFTAEIAATLPEHTPFAALHPNIFVPSIASVESEEQEGARAMVRYLISLGHRRILHVSGRRGLLGAERRILGYQQALAEAGLPYDPQLLLEADFGFNAARVAFDSWCHRNVGQEMPTAIFGGNDTIAISCLEVLSARGLKVPGDVSICGFDDSLAARTINPQLTTVRQPVRLMALRCVELLLERIRHAHARDEHHPGFDLVRVPTEIIVRDSASTPPATPRTIPGS